jgi:hypothetical protein
MSYNVHNGDAPLALLKSFLFLFIVPVLISEDIDLMSLMIRTGVFVALATLAMVAINFFAPVVFLVLYDFTIAKQIAIVSPSRDVLGMGLGAFFYKTAPLMIFPFAYYSWRFIETSGRRWTSIAMTLLYGAALVYSGTRANILGAMFVFGALALMRVRRSVGWPAAAALTVLILLIILVTVVPKALDTQEISNVVKLGHLHSYEEELNTRWAALLWGEGANTAFYSQGVQDWTILTELTYLEVIRLFGLPVTIVFGAGLIWIGYLLVVRSVVPVAIAYAAYLVISGSNPLLIGSTGMLMVCAAWKEAVKPSGEESAFHLPGLCA